MTGVPLPAAAGSADAPPTADRPDVDDGAGPAAAPLAATLPTTLTALIAGFVRRHARAYGLAALMLVGIAGLTVWIPRQVGHVVDGLVAGQVQGGGLAMQLGVLVAMGAAIYALRVGWRLKLYAASYRLGLALRARLYDQLVRQDAQFFQGRRTGELMALATNDIDAVEMAAGEGLLAGFDGTLTLVLVVAMMALGVDLWLAAAALLPFPLMAVSFWFISRQVHVSARRALDRFSDLNDHVQQSVAGVRTVRALGLAPHVQAQLAGHAGAAAAASVDEQRWEAAYEPAVGASLAAAAMLTLGVGGWRVAHGDLTVGQLTAFSMYLGQLIWPMFAAGWVLSLFERGRAAWLRLEPVLRAVAAIRDDGDRTVREPGDLVFERVSLTYPDQVRPALHEVGLSLAPGRTLGVVGPTGAGKSSLLALVLRQYTPQAGRIRWGGPALADYRLQTLRKAIAWVPQEAFLFSASVHDNIALARPDASRADVEHVARLAALHDDIVRLPEGYGTRVGERGVTLSGGQRQRVAIARALLADAPLLLLDDALSAVDTGTEARILGHLRVARQGRTAIIVSHRLSSVADADRIVVLQEGRVTEQGTHAELLAAEGWYAAQWRYQQLQASLDADEAAEDAA